MERRSLNCHDVSLSFIFITGANFNGNEKKHFERS